MIAWWAWARGYLSRALHLSMLTSCIMASQVQVLFLQLDWPGHCFWGLRNTTFSSTLLPKCEFLCLDSGLLVPLPTGIVIVSLVISYFYQLRWWYLNSFARLFMQDRLHWFWKDPIDILLVISWKKPTSSLSRRRLICACRSIQRRGSFQNL